MMDKGLGDIYYAAVCVADDEADRLERRQAQINAEAAELAESWMCDAAKVAEAMERISFMRKTGRVVPYDDCDQPEVIAELIASENGGRNRQQSAHSQVYGALEAIICAHMFEMAREFITK
jgi:hypothetical protein